MAGEKTRELNAAIARNYDQLGYDPFEDPRPSVGRLFGHAAVFGEVKRPVDVLDLGCGTGVYLNRAGGDVEGLLVGTDISPGACERARTALKDHGERAKIICADALDLEPEDLGEFDLILIIGVIYITPPEVREKILELAARCLRPGGVIVISYYSGSVSALRADVYRALRFYTAGLGQKDALFEAKQRLKLLTETLDERPGSELLQAAIRGANALGEETFFHEALNGAFDAIQTGYLERRLSEAGISFTGSVYPQTVDRNQSSRGRADEADLADFGTGKYRFGVFAKFLDGPLRPFGELPVKWESWIAREAPFALEGEQEFFSLIGDQRVTSTGVAATAMFDALISGPLTWREIEQRVDIMLEEAHLAEEKDLARMESSLLHVWPHGLVFPVFDPEASI